ncbi:MAG: oligosaccharide flippase family protein [Gammaproteobacteria bacterium]
MPAKPVSSVLGFLWVLLSNLIIKSSGLVTQFCLGWFLSKSDFALYALASSIYFAGIPFRGGGVAEILIQRGKEYDQLAPLVFKFSLFFNVVGCFLLIALAPFAVRVFGDPGIFPIVIAYALSFPMGTPFVLFSAKLAVTQRFGALSRVTTASSLARQMSTIGLAYYGFGAMSFALAAIIESVFQSAMGWSATRSWPASRKLSRAQFITLFRDARWVMVGALILTLGTSGDYFILGIMEDKESLAMYFFAFQLTSSVSQIFQTALATVAMPSLAKLNDNKSQQAQIYQQVVAQILLLSVPATVFLVLFVGAAIHLAWQGKWDDSISIAQILACNIPSWLSITFSRAMIDAKGWWRLRLVFLAVSVIPGLAAIAAGAYWGGVFEAALGYTCYLFVFAICQAVWLAGVLSASRRAVLRDAVKTMLGSFVPAAAAWYIGNTPIGKCLGSWREMCLIATFFSLIVLVQLAFFRRDWARLTRRFLGNRAEL